MTILILSPPDAMRSCVAAWEDLFILANRELTARGGKGTYQVFSYGWADRATIEGLFSRQGGGVLLLPSVWTLDALRFNREGAAETSACVAKAHGAGWMIASVCGGNFYAAGAGILAGCRATTHWSLTAEFAKAFPLVKLCPDEMVVDNGSIILGGGITAYFDVGLHLLARLEGPDFSRHCANILIIDPVRPRQWLYSEDTLTRDPDIIRAEAWLEGHLAEKFTIAQWAAASALEERTLNRRFRKIRKMSPNEYVQKRRVLKARDLLERTASPWDAVTDACGYSDGAGFRRLFKKETGLTPKNYRERFARAGAYSIPPDFPLSWESGTPNKGDL